MKKDGRKLFSPEIAMSELKDADDEKVIRAFEDRIRGWYLDPLVSMLEKPNWDFISLAIECMLLDALSGYYFGLKEDSNRGTFQDFAEEIIPEVGKESIAGFFYDTFRNGILHETRVKKSGFISREIKNVIVEDDGALFVNPRELYRVLKNWFDLYAETLYGDEDLQKRFFDRFIFLYEDHIEFEGGALFERHIRG